MKTRLIFIIFCMSIIALFFVCNTVNAQSTSLTQCAVITSDSGNVLIINADGTEILANLTMPEPVYAAVINPAGTYIYISGSNGCLYELRTSDYTITRTLQIPYGRSVCMLINSNGDTLYGSIYDWERIYAKSVFVVDLKTFTLTTTYGDRACNSIAFDTTDNWLIASTVDYIYAFDISTGSQVQTIHSLNHSDFGEISVNGRSILFVNDVNNSIDRYDIYTGLKTDAVFFEYPTSIVRSPNYNTKYMSYVLSDVSQNMTSVDDLIPGSIGTFGNKSTYADSPYSVRLSPDGNYLYVTNSKPGSFPAPDPYVNILSTQQNLTGFIFLNKVNTSTSSPYVYTGYIAPKIIVSNQVVKITISSLYGMTTYSNVPITVKDNSGNVISTQVTGDDGSAPFLLSPNTMYTITAYDPSRNINQTVTLYPTNTEYNIDVGLSPIINFNGLWHSADINQSYTFVNGTGDPLRDVTLTVSQSPHNIPTSRTITARYTDNTASTNTVNSTLYKVINNNSVYVSSQLFTLAKKPDQTYNGGFESGDFTGWTIVTGPNATIYNVNSPVYSGNHAIEINCVNYTSQSYIIENTNKRIPVNPGESWTATVKIKNNAPGARYAIEMYRSNGLYISNLGPTTNYEIAPSTDNQWHEYVISGVIPANVAYIDTGFVALRSTGTVYIDDFTMSSDTAISSFNIANETQNKAPSSFKVVDDANTDAYGSVERVGYASWDGTGYLLPGLGLDNKALPYAWICFGVVFLIVIIGTYLSNGIIIFIAGGAWEVMIALGWMSSSAQNFALGALVMAIGAGYILMQKRREMV